MFILFIIALVLATGQAAREPDPNAPPASRAEGVLRAFRQTRPPNAPIAPGSAGDADREKKRKLLPEGWSIIDQTGVVEKTGDVWRFVSDPGAGTLPLRLLENAQLEMMTRMNAGSTTPICFTVSGEVTVFGGENCLLVRTASRDRTRPAAASEKPVPTERLRADAPASNVLDRLRGQEPERPVLSPTAPSLLDRRPTGVSRSLMLDGTPLIQRVGRVVRQDQGWVLISDSDRGESADPPLRLLPNQTLETIIREIDRGGGVVFVVSGEVTLFDATNHLLARAVTRRVDLGNLRR